jgi:hypothetical protein
MRQTDRILRDRQVLGGRTGSLGIDRYEADGQDL